MCIIIYKKENAVLPTYNILRKCFNQNSDGAGFCYVNDKNIIKMEKGFFEFKSFYRRLSEVQNDRHLLIHMRIATGGRCDINNCHPFKIRKGLYFAHNGVLNENVFKPNMAISDTFIFNELVKSYSLQLRHFNNSYFLDLMKSQIGRSNRMVFFSAKKYFIVNERLGNWEDGVWFSNDGYRTANNCDYYGRDLFDYRYKEKR